MDLLKENDEFHSWEEWKSRFDEWCQATGQQYKVNTSRLVFYLSFFLKTL